MKHIHIILEDEEAEAIEKKKGERTWREFLLGIQRKSAEDRDEKLHNINCARKDDCGNRINRFEILSRMWKGRD